MKKELKPLCDLTLSKELEKYEADLGKLSSDFECQLNRADSSIAVKCKGEYLETVPFGDGEEDIAFRLERKKHLELKISDLEIIGGAFSVASSSMGLDTIIFHVDSSKKTISAETALDSPSNEVEWDKIVAAIKNNSSITILSDGATSDKTFAELQKGVGEINKKAGSSDRVEVKTFQYGPMWIEIEIEKPDALGELVNKIDGIRSSLLV